jgi:hypothetical protein
MFIYLNPIPPYSAVAKKSIQLGHCGSDWQRQKNAPEWGTNHHVDITRVGA